MSLDWVISGSKDGVVFGVVLDQVIEKAALLHGFPNLQDWHTEVNSITERSVDCLLTLNNPLKKIRIASYNLNEDEEELKNKWNNMVKKNNWNLSIVILL